MVELIVGGCEYQVGSYECDSTDDVALVEPAFGFGRTRRRWLRARRWCAKHRAGNQGGWRYADPSEGYRRRAARSRVPKPKAAPTGPNKPARGAAPSGGQ